MNTLIVYHDKYAELVSYVIKLFPEHTLKERETLTEKDYVGKELIIVVGGDGTFLRANHLNKEIPVFGINPDPENKVGFFTRADAFDYKEKLDKLLEKNYQTSDILRLEAYINDKKIKEISLNEIFIGDPLPFNMFNYDISVDKKTEFQRSSGILVGTPAGSHAWIKSAGGKILDLKQKKFQYVIREPYTSRLTPEYELVKGLLEENKEIIIRCKTPGILVMDSIGPVHKLDNGDVVKIQRSCCDLKLIEL